MSALDMKPGMPKWVTSRLLGKHAKRNMVLVMAVAAVYATLCCWPFLVRAPVFGLLAVLVCVLFCIFPYFLTHEAGRGGATSLLLAVAGFLWPTNHLYEWGGELPVRLAMMGSCLFWWTAACACLLFPQQRLGPTEKIYLTLLAAGLGVPEIYLLIVHKTYVDTPSIGVLTALLGAGFLAAALARFRRYQGVERQTLAPVLTAGSLIALAGGTGWFILVSNGTYTQNANQRIIDLTYGGQALLLILLAPVGFLVAGLRRRFIQAAVAPALALLPAEATPEEVRQALREALGDDRLDILYQFPGCKTYVDANGRPVDISSEPSTDEVRIPLRASGGEPWALLVIDKQLAREAALFEDSVSAPWKPNLMAWIQVHERAHVERQRALHRRLEAARWKERHRLSRDLHDGVQQRLLVLQLVLTQVDALVAQGKPVSHLIDQSRQQLREVLTLFRETIQGFAPVELQHGGLGPALQGLIERQPFSVEARISPERGSFPAELVAYNIACEAFSNIIKHSRATHALIETTFSDNLLTIRIADDGIGGAHVNSGSGLPGLKDRVVALGGDLVLRSPKKAGTELIARIPCE